MIKQTAILVAALLFVPITAAGQGIAPEQRGFSANGGPAVTRGITVTGSGQERVTATSAQITLNLNSATRANTITKTKLQPLVDALVKAGADPASVHLPVNLDPPGSVTNNASIAATVDHPSAELVQRSISTVGAAIAAMNDVNLSGAMVLIKADGCQSAMDAARKTAITRARAKAESIAKDLNVQVGSAINVTSMEALQPDGSCSTQYYVGGFNSAQSPQDLVAVPVTSTITITYAIK
jgi:uncharacterized protein YggE